MKLRLIDYTMTNELEHGTNVSNLAYLVSKEMKLDEDQCRTIAMAGLVHDIGKIAIADEMNMDNPLVIEEMMYIRRHPSRGYDILKRHDVADEICNAVLYHHENWDGTGYPENLRENAIPLAACILRICDEFCELTSDQPHRKAYSIYSAVPLLVGEAKNFRVDVFMAFQRVLHSGPDSELKFPDHVIDLRGELDQIWH